MIIEYLRRVVVLYRSGNWTSKVGCTTKRKQLLAKELHFCRILHVSHTTSPQQSTAHTSRHLVGRRLLTASLSSIGVVHHVSPMLSIAVALAAALSIAVRMMNIA